ncbi:MAG TPA: MarR family transcriptional regulator [Acidimicrobiales bacterium]|nr:MarR family transcriptional regulator [Acidimicrobiales bacterium]
MVSESRPGIPDAGVIRRGVNRLDRRLRSEGPADGLALGKLSTLGHLARVGRAMTPGELAAADRLRPQSVTRVIADLERDGLVCRQRDATDGRRFRIGITDDGLAMLRRDMHQRDVWLAHVIEQELSPTEQGVLCLAGELLDRLADATAMVEDRSEGALG